MGDEVGDAGFQGHHLGPVLDGGFQGADEQQFAYAAASQCFFDGNLGDVGLVALIPNAHVASDIKSATAFFGFVCGGESELPQDP